MSITRRRFLQVVGASSAAVALSDRLAFATDNRPNIVLILSDDHGYAEIGSQGLTDIPAPNIDSIARDGVRFTDGYVSCPVCSPTRAGLMTGRYQQRFGHEFNPGASPNFGLPLSETTVAARLKAAGYVTGIVGKWHLGDREGYRPTERGFDEFYGFLGGAHSYLNLKAADSAPIFRGTTPIDENEYLTDAFGREAASFIRRHRHEPFFLYLAFNAVHTPMQTTDKHLGRFSGIADEKRRTYAGMLSAMDDAIGRALAALRANGLERNTLVFFLSDNGGPTQQNTSSNAPLRGGKALTYEGGIRVPFLMRWPDQLSAGTVYKEPVIALDIAPTILAAAGVRADYAAFDGINLVPYIRGEMSGPPHDALYWRYGEQSAIRCGDWKLRKGATVTELFDLALDIGEKHDITVLRPDKVEELQAKLAKWESELIEPLWRPRQRRQQPAAQRVGG